MRVAFYKGKEGGLSGFFDTLIRWWTKSPYSHCELVFDEGMDSLAASSSRVDGGVRFKQIQFTNEDWDFVEIPDELKQSAYIWFKTHVGNQYDMQGDFHFFIGPVGPDEKDHKYFCSEAVGYALGIAEAWRFDPGTLYAALKHARWMYSK